jgi:hypothetical protein
MVLTGRLELIPWFVQQILTALSYMLICYGLRWGEHYGKRILEALFLCIGLPFLGLGINYVMQSENVAFPAVWNCVQGIVLMLYLHLFSNYRRSTKIVLWCSLFAGILAISPMAGQASYLMGELASGWPEAVVRTAVHCLLPLFAVYLSRFNFNEFEKMPRSGLVLILTGDICLSVLAITESIWRVADSRVFMRFLIVYICIFGMILASIYGVYSICREHENTLLLREETQQLEKEKERFHMAEGQMEEIRSLRHDLKNQRSYMRILLKEKRYEELERYFSQSEDEISVPKSYINCGNKSVNVILNMEYAKIDSGIEIDSLLVVPPVLPFQDDEICSVLTNLLDNAIEECRRMREKGSADTRIRLEIYPEANYLYIMCANTTDRSQLSYWKDGIRSTKSDVGQHGYGTQIVARIAEKYDGCAEYTIKDGHFVAKIMMDMLGEQNDSNCNVRR